MFVSSWKCGFYALQTGIIVVPLKKSIAEVFHSEVMCYIYFNYLTRKLSLLHNFQNNKIKLPVKCVLENLATCQLPFVN